MTYLVEELRPKNPVLIIDGKEFKISLITLNIDVELKDLFGGLDKCFDLIRDNPVKILEVMWPLVIDKNFFDNNLQKFTVYIRSAKESLADIAKKMYKCFEQSAVRSMPLVKNKKRQKEIQDIKGAAGGDKPCYALYLDTVLKRYGGFTIDSFYDLTLRQLHIILKTIGEKSYDELEVQASLLGRQLQPRIKFDDITEEEDAQNEEQALEVLKRLQKEYEKNKGK